MAGLEGPQQYLEGGGERAFAQPIQAASIPGAEEEPQDAEGKRVSRIGLKYKVRDVCSKCGKKHGDWGKKAEACRKAEGEEPILDSSVCKHCGKKHPKDGNGKKAHQCRQQLAMRGLSYAGPQDGDCIGDELYQPEEPAGSSSNSSSSNQHNKRRRTDDEQRELVSIFEDIQKAQKSVQLIGTDPMYGDEDSHQVDALSALERAAAIIRKCIDTNNFM